MHYCSACHKAIATVVVLDLTAGAVSGQQQLCAACAEQLGVVQTKAQIKLSSEILEDLLGGLKGKPTAAARRRDAGCAGCGTTLQDFKTRGRVGCPRCYDTFRNELLPLLQRVHEAQSHRGRLPGRRPEQTAGPTTAAGSGAGAGAVPGAGSAGMLSELRRKLEEAIRGERYEEAARLRDELRTAEAGEAGSRP